MPVKPFATLRVRHASHAGGGAVGERHPFCRCVRQVTHRRVSAPYFMVAWSRATHRIGLLFARGGLNGASEDGDLRGNSAPAGKYPDY